MAAVLSSDMDNTDKVVGFIEECKAMGLKVLPPNVNRGIHKFSVSEQGEIIYGLGAIKGAGEAAIENIVEQRELDGPYQDLFSFCQRLDTHKVNRRVLEPLIKSGAMDDFGVERAVLSASVDRALKSAEQKLKNEAAGQNDLFGGIAADAATDVTVDYVDVPAWSELDRLRAEKETLGMYVSGHPLNAYQEDLSHMTLVAMNALATKRGKTAKIAGILLSKRLITTRTGRRMAVLTLEGLAGRLEITLFSQLFDAVAHDLEADQVYIVSGKVEDDDYTGGVRMVAETIEPLMVVREQMIRKLMLTAANPNQVNLIMQSLPDLIQPYLGGECPISIAYQNNDAKAELQLAANWQVRPSAELLKQLEKIFGAETITVRYA